MIYFAISGEEGSLLSHFGENAPGGPQVDAEGVVFLRKEDLRAPIPKRNDLVRVGFYRHAECSGEAEVSELDRLPILTDQQVLRLQVPVEYPVRVEEHEGLQDLVRETLRLLRWQSRPLLLHILLEVILEVLEHQVELLLRKQHFLELYDVRVFEVLEEGNFPNSRTWDAIILLFKSNLLNCYDFVCFCVLCLVYDTIGSLSEFLEPLVLVEVPNWLGQCLFLLYGLLFSLHFAFFFRIIDHLFFF